MSSAAHPFAAATSLSPRIFFSWNKLHSAARHLGPLYLRGVRALEGSGTAVGSGHSFCVNCTAIFLSPMADPRKSLPDEEAKGLGSCYIIRATKAASQV
jgi:hypothetical protein